MSLEGRTLRRYERIETKTSICPACGRQLKPSDALRSVELALSDDAIPFSELAVRDDVDLDYQEARAWMCSQCVAPLAALMASMRGTLLKVTGRSS